MNFFKILYLNLSYLGNFVDCIAFQIMVVYQDFYLYINILLYQISCSNCRWIV